MTMVDRIAWIAAVLTVTMTITSQTHAQRRGQRSKPNIVVIWGDDIGRSNLSTFTDGMMGYRTPNIDRIANEGTIDQALETLQSAHGK